jgi:hypothetical protein
MAELAGAVLPVAGAGLAGTDAVLAGAGMVSMICVILNVSVLARAAVVFSEAGVLGAGFSGAIDVACPEEANAGLVDTSNLHHYFVS